MTHIRGSISKVKEVLTKGYKISAVQTASIDVTSVNVAGTSYQTYSVINIPGSTYKNGYMKKISITCNDSTVLNEAYLTVRDVATGVTAVFWRAFFYVNGEWELNDASIFDTEEYLITLGNYTGGGVLFTANLTYIEV